MNETFCIAPWIHLHVTQAGNVTPCCRISQPLANVNREDPRSIWQSAKMRSLRLKFLSGEKDPLCRACYLHEETGNESYRQYLNKRFAHHLDWARETAPDGSVQNARPIYWDIRFSNVCNFRCRTCWHGASSRWYGDSLKLGTQVADRAVIRNIEDSHTFLETLQALAPDVEEVVFAGGEPLLMEEHYRTLNDLISRGLQDVRIRCVTNLSELRYRQTDVIALWNKFSQVEVNASLDGIGRHGELVRKDLSWDRFVENVRRVRDEAPHVDFQIHMTVSVLNIFQVPEVQRFLLEEGLVEYGKLELRPLHDPPYYNVKMLPASIKRKAAKLLHAHADFVEAYGIRMGFDRDCCATERARVQSLIDFMQAEDMSEHILAFARTTRSLDRLRDEKCADLCPELRPLIEWPLLASSQATARLLAQKLRLVILRAIKPALRTPGAC